MSACLPSRRPAPSPRTSRIPARPSWGRSCWTPLPSRGLKTPSAPLAGRVVRSLAITKTGRPILATQSSVSVVPRAQIEEQGATNLSEALSYSAGIVTGNYGGDPRFDSLFLRGFNLENDKFLDGLRLMRATQFPTSAPVFELYGLDRVEVLRGPALVFYGAGSPAGLVNMVQSAPPQPLLS
ncbi:TonB-dependent receptor plug domain-containing protein (plasmid) [Paracoccus pantotrophus]|uniref:TonB-dependent receptor plug domain-containing protein n=1 Tax=Paracoccus pantotrophus TaxID=82367 RepID=A0A7H9BZQ7_PARPN|nr:TonB-dependent receptor plug domain-containing protein [Paracoccus pantotrophus]RDD95659.1 hypothetical protein DTW92_15645 [Paracoccus pantotrophus]WGR66153.1 hypothetical protein E3U24_12565 [Paracoccus pantotrophus]